MTTVMIVDDEEDVRLVTRLILEEAGYEVSERRPASRPSPASTRRSWI